MVNYCSNIWTITFSPIYFPFQHFFPFIFSKFGLLGPSCCEKTQNLDFLGLNTQKMRKQANFLI